MCRETANIWFWLFSKYGSPKKFFKRKIWKSPYFWRDSFFKYLDGLIGCRIFGHKLFYTDWENGMRKQICKKCYKEVKI